jgi:hypothetical protein
LGLSEPVIEDLTRDALKLLSFELDDLYAILGCQLLAAAPPTRVAHMLVWLVDLRKTESPADEWISRGEKIRNDLQCDGTSFVDSIKEDLRKSLCTKDILDLTGDIDESKMQILIMLVSAILKIPPQLESISATLAAMFCKSMLREVCL